MIQSSHTDGCITRNFQNGEIGQLAAADENYLVILGDDGSVRCKLGLPTCRAAIHAIFGQDIVSSLKRECRGIRHILTLFCVVDGKRIWR